MVSGPVSTPISSDLSKPSSTSNLNSTSSFGNASSFLNSTSVARSGTPLFSSIPSTLEVSFVSASSPSSSILNSALVIIPSFSPMAAPPNVTDVTPTDPTSQLLSSTDSSFLPSSFPVNAFSPSPTSLKFSQTKSPSDSTPKNTGSKFTETSVQHTSEPGSTITSVIVVSTTSSKWDTITEKATSTLSEAVVLTTTNSVGSEVITTPPLVTLWSTTTDGNGVLFTATAVVANPPEADLTSETGILHNTGAVAAIFSVVGVVFASLVVFLVIYVRRRRKAHQHEKWLAGMETQRPSSFSDDPFRDQSEPPSMRTVGEDEPWDRKGFLTPEDSNHGDPTFGQPKASIFPVYPIWKDGTFGQPVIHQQTVDMGSPTEFNKTRYSVVSTPSLYPEDDDREAIIVPNFNQIATTSNIPPRPPRSLLRDRSTKLFSSSLPTQPESEYLNNTNIVSEPRSRDYVSVLDRKTILDVQSRLISQ